MQLSRLRAPVPVAMVAAVTPGQKVPVEIRHADGSTATVTVTIGQYPG